MPNRARLFASLLVVIGLAAGCGDRSSPLDPGGTGRTSSFSVALPDTVHVGASFDVTIRALDADGASADPSFSGQVSLSASEGTVTPSTLSLVDGVGVGQLTLRGTAGAVTVTVTSGTAVGRGTLTVIGDAPVASVVVTPASILLTGPGAEQQLSAHAYDALGRPTAGTFSWTSTSSSVAVSEGGLVTASAGVASAQITAAVDGVASAPAVAVVAPVVDDVMVISDAQVVGAPVAVGPAEAFGVGWRYRVILAGVPAPAPGSLLVGSGGEIVAGRVVEVTSSGDGWAVTLEVVPLTELFQNLRLELDMALPQEDPLPAGGSAPARAPLAAAGSGAPLRASPGNTEIEFPVGPFKCKVGGEVPIPVLSVQNVSSSVEHDLRMILDFDLLTGLENLSVHGSVRGRWTARPIVEQNWVGGAKCELEVASPTLPTFGWLSLYFGFKVPLGIGFEIKGELEVGGAGLDLVADASATVAIEASCPIDAVDCSWILNVDPTWEGSVRPVVPSADDLRLAFNGRGYAFAKLNLGPNAALVSAFPVLENLKFKLLEASFGVTEEYDLAAPMRQVSDSSYHSTFDLQLDAELKADIELKTGLEWLGQKLGVVIQVVDFPLWTHEWSLAQSPRGTFAIEPLRVVAGDATRLGERATFTVDLDPVTYLGSDAVESVEIRWQRDDGTGGFTLGNGRPGCHVLPATPGQTRFTCETDFLEEHVGEQVFHAFVHTQRFGAVIPVPLAVAPNASATVTVVEAGQIVVEPTFPDTVVAGEPETLRVRVGRVVSGVIEYGAGYTVEFYPNYATVQPETITTDEQGMAEVVVTPVAGGGWMDMRIVAYDAGGQSGTAIVWATVLRPPGEVSLLTLQGYACNAGVGSVDDLPLALSGSRTYDNGDYCNATINLSAEPQPDGSFVFDLKVTSQSTLTDAGRVRLTFSASGPFTYHFDGKVPESAARLYLMRGDGQPNMLTPILGCAGNGLGLSNHECPTEFESSGTIMANTVHTLRADFGQEADGELTLVLTPVP